METIGLFYGSDGGNTQEVAQAIAKTLNNVELYDVAKADKSALQAHKNLILATPTYGDGDLQNDWDSFLATLDIEDFDGKTIALVGLGDQDMYDTTFCNGLYVLYEKVSQKGKIIGRTDTQGYSYTESQAVVGDQFVGLILDVENQEELTQKRITQWCDSIKSAFA